MPFFKRKQDKQKATSPVGKEPVSVKRTPSTRSNPQSPDSINGDIGVPSSLLSPPGGGTPSGLLLSEDVLSSVDSVAGETGTPKSPMKTSSRLSKTLQEILHDKDALHCFIQFMESQQAERFIRFWLDANSFKAATLTRMRTNSLQSVSNSAMMKRRTETTGRQGGAESVGTHRQDVDSKSQPGDGPSANDCPEGVSQREERTGDGESEGQTACDSSKPNTSTEDTSHASGSGTPLRHSPQNLGQECVNEGREKPSSLSLHPASVQVRVTSDSDDAHSSQNPISEGLLCSTNMSQSSLQDSGIAIPSDGEFVITPNSQSESPGDNESVDTLIDDDATDENAKAASEGKASSRVSDGETEDRADSAQSGSKRENQAASVIGEDVGTSTKEDSECAGKARSVSMEEMREKLKKSIERDAVSIFTKYIAKDAPQPIGVDDTLRGETISKICREDKQVDPECFVACQDFVVRHMEKVYHQPFMDSEFHCKHQVTVLTSGQVYLADILYNEHALCYFMEFMEQENAQHLMQFWMAADNFQQQLIQHEGGYDGMQAQSDAMILYDRFFSLQATTPLGFDDKIRFEVESNICRESGPLPDCFSKPRDIVLHTFEKVYFPRYLSSEIYYRYLSDLISTVQMAQDLPVRKHRRQASDASSEHSAGSHSVGAEGISTRNTLLAAGSRGARKSGSSSSSSLTSTSVAGKIEEQLGTIDTDFLNPDELWKQPTKSTLRLGTVNSLGQFVSEFDPHPDGSKKKGVGFFKKMKNKDKEEEEMAVKVAQMILSDVANMTQMGDACAAPDTSEDDTNNSRTTTAPSPLSLPSPFGTSPLFEPPPS